LGKYSEVRIRISLSRLVAAYVAKFVLCKSIPKGIESVITEPRVVFWQQNRNRHQ
jgi:hypothetical protein